MISEITENSNKKVLVCDDDDLLREFYSRVLKSQGFSAIVAIDGEDAVNVLSENSDISLAIIDLLMPIKTGWELIEYMKTQEELKNIPIVAITGLATSFDEFKKVKETCEDVILKGDFDLNQFNEIIQKFL